MRAHALAFLGREAGEEMAGELGNILGALAQRRHRNRKHVQAVEQVLAEASGLHVGDQVAVGGGDDAHVDLDGLRPPTGSTSPSCSARSSLTCAASGNSPTSSRNSVPPSASTNLPVCLLGGAGEGALLVAEQDRLDQVLGHGAAIDRDERLGAARALAVDGARDQLLADAGFALDQHRDGGARRLLGACAAPACMRGASG